MLEKYRRPDYRRQAKSYQRQIALTGQPSVAQKTANVRKTIGLMYVAIAVYAVVCLYLGYRFGIFEFIASAQVEGRATVVEKKPPGQSGNAAYKLQLLIDDGLEHTIRTEVLVDRPSWDAVSKGTELRCTYLVNKARDKARVVELVLEVGQHRADTQ
jgi:hypothetical protein